jgi:predicted ArsR family transcriptional regulator
MDIKDILSRYVNAAIAHGEAIENGNHKVANKQHDVIMRLLHKLDEAGKRGEALSSILDHRDPHVRGWAATHLLNVDSAKAIRALEALVNEGGLAGFNAEMTLAELRKGRLRIP